MTLGFLRCSRPFPACAHAFFSLAKAACPAAILRKPQWRATGSNDDPGNITENRPPHGRADGRRAPSGLLTLYQTHSPDVCGGRTGRGMVDRGRRPMPSSPRTEGPRDRRHPRADCGPILFVDPSARGDRHRPCRLERARLTGIVESTVDAMEKLGARTRRHRPPPIGPLIRQHSYEVGGEFVERFSFEADARECAVSSSPANAGGHSMFDLAGFIRMRLGKTPAC